MPPPNHDREDSPQNSTIRAIAVQARRETLKPILERGPVSEESLAEYRAAVEHGTHSPDDTQIQSAHLQLVHLHLPVLADAGLIDWDTESSTVDTTAHPALTDARFRSLLRLDSAGVDDVLDALSHEYRRIVLAALWAEEAVMSVPTLARKIAHCRDQADPMEADSIDEIAVVLQHSHLPKLAGSDLLEYDRQASRVTYTGHPTLEEVLAIIYEPDDHLIDKYDGVLSGLLDSYRAAEPELGRPAEWPHWGQYHG